MKKNLFFFLFFTYNLFSQNSGIQFLKFNLDARTNAMGNVSTAIGSTSINANSNPALLSNDKNDIVEFAYKNSLIDTKTSTIATKTNWNNFSFGILFNSTTISEIEIREIAGNLQGTFDAKYVLGNFMISYLFENNFSFGISNKIVYEKIFVDDATGFAFDFGVLKNFENFSIGISLNNFGRMNSLKNKSTEFPKFTKVGILIPYEISKNFKTNFSIDEMFLLKEKNLYLHSGIEVLYNDIIAFRTGFQNGYEVQKHFSFGCGVNYQNIVFNYAFIQNNFGFDNENAISITYIFQ